MFFEITKEMMSSLKVSSSRLRDKLTKFINCKRSNIKPRKRQIQKPTYKTSVLRYVSESITFKAVKMSFRIHGNKGWIAGKESNVL